MHLGRLFAMFCKWIILWTSSLDSLVRGSKDWMSEAFHSVSWHFIWYILSPPNAGILSSSKMQSACRAVNKSPVRGSRYFMIDGDLYPTYIPNFLWGPIDVRCGGDIGMYTAHPNFRRWEIFGWFPRTNYNEEAIWYAVGLSWIKSMVCKSAWSQHDVGKLQFCNNGHVISVILLIRDSANPFLYVCMVQSVPHWCLKPYNIHWRLLKKIQRHYLSELFLLHVPDDVLLIW